MGLLERVREKRWIVTGHLSNFTKHKCGDEFLFHLGMKSSFRFFTCVKTRILITVCVLHTQDQSTAEDGGTKWKSIEPISPFRKMRLRVILLLKLKTLGQVLNRARHKWRNEWIISLDVGEVKKYLLGWLCEIILIWTWDLAVELCSRCHTYRIKTNLSQQPSLTLGMRPFTVTSTWKCAGKCLATDGAGGGEGQVKPWFVVLRNFCDVNILPTTEFKLWIWQMLNLKLGRDVYNWLVHYCNPPPNFCPQSESC